MWYKIYLPATLRICGRKSWFGFFTELIFYPTNDVWSLELAGGNCNANIVTSLDNLIHLTTYPTPTHVLDSVIAVLAMNLSLWMGNGASTFLHTWKLTRYFRLWSYFVMMYYAWIGINCLGLWSEIQLLWMMIGIFNYCGAITWIRLTMAAITPRAVKEDIGVPQHIFLCTIYQWPLIHLLCGDDTL